MGPRRELTTKRLVLRAVEERGATELWPAIEASLAELNPWMPWAPDASPEETLEFARRMEQAWHEGSDFVFFVLLEEVPVGTIGLNHVSGPAAGGEIGYWIRSDLAGEGLTTEAASAVVGFAFDDLGLHRLELHAGVDNVASRRVAEKLGFREEGILRHGSRGLNGWYDVVVYGLLHGDPRPAFH